VLHADEAPTVPVVVALDSPVTGAPAGRRTVAVPNVKGMPLREAVAALHRAGVQVRLGRGPAGTTLPVAGARVARGSTVRLMHDED